MKDIVIAQTEQMYPELSFSAPFRKDFPSNVRKDFPSDKETV
jgi:hypothetical protein